jgi:hypothetical protein
VAAFLTEAWVAEATDPAAEALAARGGTLDLLRVVGGGPEGEVRLRVVVADGTVRCRPAAAVADAGDPELTLTDNAADLGAVLRGELDPNAAFMQGRTKVVGSTGKLLELLAATRDERYEQARSELAARTEF